MKIAPMTKDDIPALVNMGRLMHEESAYAWLPFSAEKCKELGHFILGNPETQCCFVAHAPCPIGMIAGYLTDYWFGAGKLAQDRFWYVAPSHRGGSAGMRLMATWVEWARDADEICNGVSTEIDTERTGALLERLGFRKVGLIYKRKVD